MGCLGGNGGGRRHVPTACLCANNTLTVKDKMFPSNGGDVRRIAFGALQADNCSKEKGLSRTLSSHFVLHTVAPAPYLTSYLLACSLTLTHRAVPA